MESFLESVLTAPGNSTGDGFSCRIGQVLVARTIEGSYCLCHFEDAEKCGLEQFSAPVAATAIARFDDAGSYRPLKSAPNLRHGWRLALTSVADVRLALDALYPAAVGIWRDAVRGELTPVPLRETLGRQSGMYRITQKLTDAQALAIRDSLCRNGCLRRILWSIEAGESALPAEPRQGEGIPLLCTEACCHFVAAARQAVKSEPS